jgi:diguanylate cyclase (GGDEF)-like protein
MRQHEPSESGAHGFGALLDAGRQIGSARSREAVFRALRTTALGLLPGHGCIVLALREGGDEEDLERVAGWWDGFSPEACRAVAAEALRSGQPLVARIDAHGAVLCVPIAAHGAPVGCICMADEGAGSVFGEEQRRLAAALARAAATTLEELNGGLGRRFTDLKAAYDRERENSRKLQRMALQDPLTSLPNRLVILGRITRAISRARRQGTGVAVLFVDIDDLKAVNDSLGHAVGDRLLTEVAGRLRTCLRLEDTAARLGGDEFAILLEDVTSREAIARTAERVIEALEAPVLLEDSGIVIHASIGIALGGPEGGSQGAAQLLSDADSAMYRAKQEGKGSYRFFEPSMRAGTLERRDLTEELERALDEGPLTMRDISARIP